MAQAPALPEGFELPLEPRLPRIGSVHAVRARGARRRAGEALDQARGEAVRARARHPHDGPDDARGRRHPGKVAALCSKAIRPDPADASVPSVAAVCVYPNLVPDGAKSALRGSGVKVASVATAFPSGQSPLEVKLEEVEAAVEPAPTRSTW